MAKFSYITRKFQKNFSKVWKYTKKGIDHDRHNYMINFMISLCLFFVYLTIVLIINFITNG